MPRSRKDEGGGAAALLIYLVGVVVVAVTYAVAFIGPIAVLGWAAYAKWKLDSLGVADPKVLLPSAGELQRLAHYEAEIDRCWSGIEQARARGEQAHLRHRQDDAFDERSRLGWELNEAIRCLESQISDLVDQQSADKAGIRGRMNEWVNAQSSWEAAKFGLVALAATFMISLLLFGVQPGATLGWTLFWSSFVASLVAFATVGLWRWLAHRELVDAEPIRGALAATT